MSPAVTDTASAAPTESQFGRTLTARIRPRLALGRGVVHHQRPGNLMRSTRAFGMRLGLSQQNRRHLDARDPVHVDGAALGGVRPPVDYWPWPDATAETTVDPASTGAWYTKQAPVKAVAPPPPPKASKADQRLEALKRLVMGPKPDAQQAPQPVEAVPAPEAVVRRAVHRGLPMTPRRHGRTWAGPSTSPGGMATSATPQAASSVAPARFGDAAPDALPDVARSGISDGASGFTGARNAPTETRETKLRRMLEGSGTLTTSPGVAPAAQPGRPSPFGQSAADTPAPRRSAGPEQPRAEQARVPQPGAAPRAPGNKGDSTRAWDQAPMVARSASDHHSGTAPTSAIDAGPVPGALRRAVEAMGRPVTRNGEIGEFGSVERADDVQRSTMGEVGSAALRSDGGRITLGSIGAAGLLNPVRSEGVMRAVATGPAINEPGHLLSSPVMPPRGVSTAVLDQPGSSSVEPSTWGRSSEPSAPERAKSLPRASQPDVMRLAARQQHSSERAHHRPGAPAKDTLRSSPTAFTDGAQSSRATSGPASKVTTIDTTSFELTPSGSVTAAALASVDRILGAPGRHRNTISRSLDGRNVRWSARSDQNLQSLQMAPASEDPMSFILADLADLADLAGRPPLGIPISEATPPPVNQGGQPSRQVPPSLQRASSRPPQAQSVEALSPLALSPQAQPAQALSPQAQPAQAQPAQALSPQALSPQALSPQAQSAQAQSPQALSPQALSPQAQSVEAQSPQALSPQAQTTQAQTTQASSDSRRQAVALADRHEVLQASPTGRAVDAPDIHPHHDGLLAPSRTAPPMALATPIQRVMSPAGADAGSPDGNPTFGNEFMPVRPPDGTPGQSAQALGVADPIAAPAARRGSPTPAAQAPLGSKPLSSPRWVSAQPGTLFANLASISAVSRLNPAGGPVISRAQQPNNILGLRALTTLSDDVFGGGASAVMGPAAHGTRSRSNGMLQRRSVSRPADGVAGPGAPAQMLTGPSGFAREGLSPVITDSPGVVVTGGGPLGFPRHPALGDGPLPAARITRARSVEEIRRTADSLTSTGTESGGDRDTVVGRQAPGTSKLPVAPAVARATDQRLDDPHAPQAAADTSTPVAARVAPADLADRFMAELNKHRQEAARPLPVQFNSIADVIVGKRKPLISTSEASRRALAAVGKVAATTGDVIHLADASALSRPTAEMTGIIAHELTHVAAPSPAPRFFDDDRHSAEERRATEVGELMRRTPMLPNVAVASTGTIARTAAPTAPTAPKPISVDSGSTVRRLYQAPEPPRLGSSVSSAAADGSNASGGSSMSSSSPVNQVRESQIDADDFEQHLRNNFDLIVELLEDRIISDLERRGGRFRGDF